MSLYDDAFSEFITRNSSLSMVYNSITYSPYEFINTQNNNIYNSAWGEQGANSRAIVLPDVINNTPTSLTNSQYIALIQLAENTIQKLNDGYLFIINQITGGTITTTGQIAPAWNTYDASYVSGRTTVPTNEALYALIQAIPSPTTRSYSYPTRSLNSAFQISTTQDADVVYSVDISCALSLSGGASGTVILETATNSGFTTGVQTVSQATTSNTGTLTIGLALTQIGTAVLKGLIPKSNWVRLRTANNTGTPTITFQKAQEVLL